jgi:RNase P subunit RPR2
MSTEGAKKTQTTRYLKVTCACCGWTARATSKHLKGRTLSCPDRECDGELQQAS